VSAGSVAHRVTPFDQNIATASYAVKSLFAQLDVRRMKKVRDREPTPHEEGNVMCGMTHFMLCPVHVCVIARRPS
jgi:hypothetical protein